VNNDANFAAWMIGRGQPIPDPVEVRDLEHRRAIAAARPHAAGFVSRLTAATFVPRLAASAIAALRPTSKAVELVCEPGCCPAGSPA
jgi:hypothetical protein